ncbi:MAG: hypothetical protein JST89_12405 [Cyanobacteria bacterium SZAS-4]|nr:hypothetical protein [Cyanobacteria bacterium SZAS-4]
MTLRSKLLVAALSCSAIFATFAAPAKCEKPVQAWEVKQTSYNLGAVDIIIAKDGMRWHNDKVGMTLLMHAPDWKLNAYNEANKKFLVLNKEEALEMFQQQRRRDHSVIDAPIRMDKNLVIAGVPAVCYCYAHDMSGVPIKFAVDVTNTLERGTKLNAEQKRYVDNAMKHERREYWMSKDITVSPRVSGVFMEKIAATKYGDCLPLRLIQIGRQGVRTTMFDTTEVKKIVLKPDTFKLPTGYTKAENKIALLVNDNDLGGLSGEEPSSLLAKPQSRKHEKVHR